MIHRNQALAGKPGGQRLHGSKAAVSQPVDGLSCLRQITRRSQSAPAATLGGQGGHLTILRVAGHRYAAVALDNTSSLADNHYILYMDDAPTKLTAAQRYPLAEAAKTSDIDAEILALLRAGKSLRQIAARYDVSNVSLWHRLQHNPDYRASLEIGLELRMDQREQELEDAETKVEVTKKDRLLGHARWLAERCAPSRFGAGQKIMGADGGPLSIEIVRYSPRVIEHEG